MQTVWARLLPNLGDGLAQVVTSLSSMMTSSDHGIKRKEKTGAWLRGTLSSAWHVWERDSLAGYARRLVGWFSSLLVHVCVQSPRRSKYLRIFFLFCYKFNFGAFSLMIFLTCGGLYLIKKCFKILCLIEAKSVLCFLSGSKDLK